jgi:hypothetical protein
MSGKILNLPMKCKLYFKFLIDPRDPVSVYSKKTLIPIITSALTSNPLKVEESSKVLVWKKSLKQT